MSSPRERQIERVLADMDRPIVRARRVAWTDTLTKLRLVELEVWGMDYEGPIEVNQQITVYAAADREDAESAERVTITVTEVDLPLERDVRIVRGHYRPGDPAPVYRCPVCGKQIHDGYPGSVCYGGLDAPHDRTYMLVDP